MITRIDYKDLDNHSRIECALCGEKPCVAIIKSAMEKKQYFYWVPRTGKYICQYCKDKIEV